jgi:uncharacterized protein YbbC (DUF1343 family)
LKNQLIKGIPEPEIRKSWLEELNKFKRLRTKYLIYP